MLTTKDIKNYTYTGCRATEQFYVCDKCNKMGYRSEVFSGTFIRKTTIKDVEYGYCPRCGQEFVVTANHYTTRELTKIWVKEEENKLLAKKLNIYRLIKIKNKFLPYKDLQYDEDTFELPEFQYIDRFNCYESKSKLSSRLLHSLVTDITNLRKYYKNVARCKFISFLAAYNDTYYIRSGMEEKFPYYSKIQNQMIKIILENEEFKDIWFTDYSKMFKKLEQLDYTIRLKIVYGMIELMKTVEEFEWVNYDIMFKPTYEEEQLMKKNNQTLTSYYTIEDMDNWVRFNQSKIDEFKHILMATDRKEEEGGINDGGKSYQLTDELREEYDKIIEEAEITKDYGLEALFC